MLKIWNISRMPFIGINQFGNVVIEVKYVKFYYYFLNGY